MSDRAASDPAGPAAPGFALFDTAVGRCAVAWNDRGLTRVRLPEPSDAMMRRNLLRDLPGVREQAPPPAVAAAIDRIVHHLRGEPAGLDAIDLDMAAVPEFYREVYDFARRIPSGQTLSYGAIAQALGKPGAARAIGQAMGKNPFPIVVPCHRVLAANQATGGFSAPGGVNTKAKLLALEGFTLHVQPELPFAAPPRRGR